MSIIHRKELSGFLLSSIPFLLSPSWFGALWYQPLALQDTYSCILLLIIFLKTSFIGIIAKTNRSGDRLSPCKIPFLIFTLLGLCPLFYYYYYYLIYWMKFVRTLNLALVHLFVCLEISRNPFITFFWNLAVRKNMDWRQILSMRIFEKKLFNLP